MFVVTNRMIVAPENAEAFERTFSSSMRENLAGVAGLSRATLLRPEADVAWLMAYANAVAALNCRRVGARGGLPTRDEVETMMATRPR